MDKNFTQPQILQAVRLSLVTSMIGTLITIILGTLLAYAVAARKYNSIH